MEVPKTSQVYSHWQTLQDVYEFISLVLMITFSNIMGYQQIAQNCMMKIAYGSNRKVIMETA